MQALFLFSKKQRSDLAALHSGGEGLGNALDLGNQGVGLSLRIVLHKRYEIHALAGEEGADIAEVGREGVVGGEGDE